METGVTLHPQETASGAVWIVSRECFQRDEDVEEDTKGRWVARLLIVVRIGGTEEERVGRPMTQAI